MRWSPRLNTSVTLAPLQGFEGEREQLAVRRTQQDVFLFVELHVT
jgi:hypothetical protein